MDMLNKTQKNVDALELIPLLAAVSSSVPQVYQYVRLLDAYASLCLGLLLWPDVKLLFCVPTCLSATLVFLLLCLCLLVYYSACLLLCLSATLLLCHSVCYSACVLLYLSATTSGSLSVTLLLSCLSATLPFCYSAFLPLCLCLPQYYYTSPLL